MAQKFKFLGEGYPKAAMSPNQPIGINTIRSMLNDACKQMGHPECTGHGFRRLFVTTLANDSGVSVEESLGSARHSSVAAQRTYIQRDGVSEFARSLQHSGFNMLDLRWEGLKIVKKGKKIPIR